MDFEVDTATLLLSVASVLIILYMIMYPPQSSREKFVAVEASGGGAGITDIAGNIQKMQKSFDTIASKIDDISISLQAVAVNTRPNPP